MNSIHSVLESPDFKHLFGLFQKDSRICYLPNFAILLHNKRCSYIYMPNVNIIEPLLGKWSRPWYSKERYIIGVVEKDIHDNAYFWMYSYYDSRDFHGFTRAEFEPIWKKLYEPDLFLTPITFAFHEDYGIPNFMIRETYRRRQKVIPDEEREAQRRVRISGYERTMEQRELRAEHRNERADSREFENSPYGRRSDERNARSEYYRSEQRTDRSEQRTDRSEQRTDHREERRQFQPSNRNEGTSVSHSMDGIVNQMRSTSISPKNQSNGILPTPSVSADSNNSSYYMKKTENTDVYNVYDSNKVCLGHASIPSMKLSRDIATFFESYTIHQYVPMKITVKVQPNGTTKYIPSL
jgi:hypothetical protein